MFATWLNAGDWWMDVSGGTLTAATLNFIEGDFE